MGIRPRQAAQPHTPSSSPEFVGWLRQALLSTRTGACSLWRRAFPPPEEPLLQSWDIPIEDGPSSPPASSHTATDGWNEAFTKLKTMDEIRQRDYKEDIDTLLVFAGLFSAVLTTFVVATFDSLQEDYSQVTAHALHHISQQLHNSTVAPLPSRPPFQPASSDIRVNMLWLISLVTSLLAALLAILVKQWFAEYMTWTSMMPGKNTVALRQYRLRGWHLWRVRRYREAIPVLLQLALVLFLCGLIDFLWNLQRTLAIGISAVAGTTLGVWVFVTLAPTIHAQCPYRSPFSWLFKWVLRLIGQYWLWIVTAPYILVTWFPIVLLKATSFRHARETVTRDLSRVVDKVWSSRRRLSLVAWDFWDLQSVDNPVVEHSNAMAATGGVVMQFPSAAVLETLSASAYEVDKITGDAWLPIRNLWSLLRCLLGDDPESQAIIWHKLKTGDTHELFAPGLPSEEFCRVVITLVRRAIRTQKACTPKDLSLVGYALVVSQIIAESEKSVLPYHTTTLAWLLHDTTPDKLVEVAKRHLRSLAGVAQISSVTRWQWDISDIVAYLNTASGLLQQSRISMAKVDTTTIALHLTKLHMSKIQQDAAALWAMNTLFGRMAIVLQHSALLPPDRWLLPLHKDWCLILADIMTVSSSANPQVSVVPPSLARAIMACFGWQLGDGWNGWKTVISTEIGSHVSAMIRTGFSHALGGAHIPLSPPSTGRQEADYIRDASYGPLISGIPGLTQYARPPLIRLRPRT